MKHSILIFLLLLMSESCYAQWIKLPLPRPVIAPRANTPRRPILWLKKIKLSFPKNDPYAEVYYRRFKYDVKIKWSEWIPKTNRYHQANALGKWQLEQFAYRMDHRISKIKVEYEVIRDSNFFGYKIGNDSWVKFHKTKWPYPSFFVAFAEYHYQDYSWKEILEDYDWCEQEREDYGCIMLCGPYLPYAQEPPAIAQKPKPSKLMDPSIYMFLGPDDPLIED